MSERAQGRTPGKSRASRRANERARTLGKSRAKSEMQTWSNNHDHHADILPQRSGKLVLPNPHRTRYQTACCKPKCGRNLKTESIKHSNRQADRPYRKIRKSRLTTSHAKYTVLKSTLRAKTTSQPKGQIQQTDTTCPHACTHARTRARARACTHERTHAGTQAACTHARTCTQTRTRARTHARTG